jgi:hypothetical protein
MSASLVAATDEALIVPFTDAQLCQPASYFPTSSQSFTHCQSYPGRYICSEVQYFENDLLADGCFAAVGPDGQRARMNYTTTDDCGGTTGVLPCQHTYSWLIAVCPRSYFEATRCTYGNCTGKESRDYMPFVSSVPLDIEDVVDTYYKNDGYSDYPNFVGRPSPRRYEYCWDNDGEFIIHDHEVILYDPVCQTCNQ